MPFLGLQVFSWGGLVPGDDSRAEPVEGENGWGGGGIDERCDDGRGRGEDLGEDFGGLEPELVYVRVCNEGAAASNGPIRRCENRMGEGLATRKPARGSISRESRLIGEDAGGQSSP